MKIMNAAACLNPRARRAYPRFAQPRGCNVA